MQMTTVTAKYIVVYIILYCCICAKVYVTTLNLPP
jgi:hypothetical protein